MTNKTILLALTCAVLFNTAAHADSVTFNQQLTFDSSPFQPSARGAEGSFSYETHYGAGWQQFVQFDSSLGTLNSIEWNIGISWSVNSSFSYQPWLGTPGYGTATETFETKFVRIGGLSLDGRVLYKTTGLPYDSNGVTVPPNAAGGLLMEGSFTHQTTDTDILNDFANGFTVFVDAQSRYANSGNYASGSPSSPHLVMDLAYTFNYTPTAVPEPSTVVLLSGAGLLAWVLGRRKS